MQAYTNRYEYSSRVLSTQEQVDNICTAFSI